MENIKIAWSAWEAGVEHIRKSIIELDFPQNRISLEGGNVCWISECVKTPQNFPVEIKQSFRKASLQIFGQIDSTNSRIIVSGANLAIDRPFSVDDFPMVRRIGCVEVGRSDAKEGGPRSDSNGKSWINRHGRLVGIAKSHSLHPLIYLSSTCDAVCFEVGPEGSSKPGGIEG
jgi:hypothetical protein